MPTTLCTDLQAIGGGASYDLVPDAGQACCVTDFASSVVFITDVPDLSIALRDGAHADAVIIIDPATAVQKADRKKEIYIDHDTYLRITNTAAGDAEVGWFGHRVRADNVRTRIVTAPSGSDVDVAADAGEVWKVTELGAETMNASDYPDVNVRFVDGVSLAAIAADGTRAHGWGRLHDWYLSELLYLAIGPIAAADNDIGLSMIRVPLLQFGDAYDVGIGATINIQPNEGYEAVVTAVAGETWVGMAPAGSPDHTFDLTDGVLVANVMEPGSTGDSIIGSRNYQLAIDNTNYMRVSNANAAANECAYVGYVRRIEHTT